MGQTFPEGINIGQGPLTVTLTQDVGGGLLLSGPVVSSVPAALQTYFGTTKGLGTFTLRKRTAIADVNTGVTLLPGFTGYKWRLVDVKMIAVGGAVTSTNATGVAVSGTISGSSTALYTQVKAALTQSTINQLGTASSTVIADGGSFVQLDVGQAITLKAVGGADLATATNIDVILTAALEA